MMKFYYPGRKFPSFSTTGNFCNLNCPHCRGKYLQGMEETKTAEILYEKAIELESRGGNGFLLSGGCDKIGRAHV